MNFLSHFYFEQKQSPEFTAGLILPDLLPGFNARLRKKVRTTQFDSPSTEKIKQGIDLHFHHDKVFHQTDFFQEMEIFTKKELQLNAFKQERSRAYLFRHICVEMLMDRILLNQRTQIGVDFFIKLDSVDKKALELFFENAESKSEAADFFAIFNRFLGSKFLLNYKDNDFFIKALIRSYQRVVPYIHFEVNDIRLLNNFIDCNTVALEPKVMRFFNNFEY